MPRPPAVAGRFYPGDPDELAREVVSFCALPPEEKPRRAIACMVPHAGYIFSGRVAGAVYARLDLPQRFVLIGPRHYPRGRTQAVLSEGAWQTPLGPAQIDAELAGELKAACSSLAEDEVAHSAEHALEVQLPFLQCTVPAFQFVPIALGPVRYPALDSLGQALAAVVQRAAAPPLIVASSDMNHYESDQITRQKDAMALERLLALDPRGLYDTVTREAITMCGMGAAVVMLVAARLLGATRATLVHYATSGDVNGDRSRVVGYAGVIFE